MNCVTSFSLRLEDEWILKELDKLGGSRSAHIVQAIKDYLAAVGVEQAQEKPPYWYVPGKDYSQLLPLSERLQLVRFGYTDKEIEDEAGQ